MKTFLKASVLVACFCFFSSLVHAEDVNVTYGKLKTELEKKGVSSQDMVSVEKPVKDMLGRGASKDDVKNFVSGLSAKGVKGADLGNAANSMNELVKDGETPKQAGNVVSQAALAAKAQGLKGKDLAAKVHEAVRERKSEMEQAKKELRSKQKEIKTKADQARERMGKEMEHQHKEMNKSMKGMGGGRGR